MHQLKSSNNSRFKDSLSQPFHTCFAMIASNAVHAGEEASKQGIHSGFETRDRRHQEFKTGLTVAPQEGHMPYNFS